jgi:hypothetical protein
MGVDMPLMGVEGGLDRAGSPRDEAMVGASVEPEDRSHHEGDVPVPHDLKGWAFILGQKDWVPGRPGQFDQMIGDPKRGAGQGPAVLMRRTHSGAAAARGNVSRHLAGDPANHAPARTVTLVVVRHGVWLLESRVSDLIGRTPWESSSDRAGARFRWPLWAAWLGVGTVAVFGVVATRLNDDDSVCDPDGPEPGALHDPGPELQLPIPPRASPLITWTGQEIVVFGGHDSPTGLPRRPCDDGAAYDPGTQRWRAITAPGFDPPLLDPSGAWLGSALVVVGQPCDDQSGPDDDSELCEPGGMAVGLYEPDRDTWRIVQPPHTPAAEGGGHVVGQRDGAAVVAVRGGDELWLLDPATEHWSQLPSPPLTGRFCADHDNIIAIGDQPRPVSPDQDTSASATDDTTRAAPPSEPPTHLWSATLPAGRNDWTQPAPIPTAPVCAAGTPTYIPAPTPLRLDPVHNTLVPMPQPPIGLGTSPTVTTADDRVVFWPDGQSAVSFTPSTQQWNTTTHQNGRQPDVAIWTGGQQYLLINDVAPDDEHLRLETLDL